MPRALSLCVVLPMIWVCCFHGDPLNVLCPIRMGATNIPLVVCVDIVIAVATEGHDFGRGCVGERRRTSWVRCWVAGGACCWCNGRGCGSFRGSCGRGISRGNCGGRSNGNTNPIGIPSVARVTKTNKVRETPVRIGRASWGSIYGGLSNHNTPLIGNQGVASVTNTR